MRNFQIADIIAKQQIPDCELSEAERQFLRDWLEESPANRKKYEEYISSIPYDDFKKVIQMFDQEEIWYNIYKETTGRRRSHPGMNRWVKYLSAAAALLLAVGAGWYLGHRTALEPAGEQISHLVMSGRHEARLMLDNGIEVELGQGDTVVNVNGMDIMVSDGMISHRQGVGGDSHSTHAIVKVPMGAIWTVSLDDGTQVTLNSGSEFKYPLAFDQPTREVSLTGEGFFEVSPDDSKPFVVHSGGMDIRVLGTVFNVFAYEGEPYIKTTLLSGSVAVSAGGTSLSEIMAPGMQALWNKNEPSIKLREVDAYGEAGWKSGRIMLNDEEFGAILRMLSRWYNVDIEYRGEEPQMLSFTGRIDRNEDLATVLGKLTMLGAPKMELKERTIVVQ